MSMIMIIILPRPRALLDDLPKLSRQEFQLPSSFIVKRGDVRHFDIWLDALFLRLDILL